MAEMRISSGIVFALGRDASDDESEANSSRSGAMAKNLGTKKEIRLLPAPSRVEVLHCVQADKQGCFIGWCSNISPR